MNVGMAEIDMSQPASRTGTRGNAGQAKVVKVRVGGRDRRGDKIGGVGGKVGLRCKEERKVAKIFKDSVKWQTHRLRPRHIAARPSSTLPRKHEAVWCSGVMMRRVGRAHWSIKDGMGGRWWWKG